jgi:hypothetical protein
VTKAWLYDGSIHRWPIKPGEQWSCQHGTVMVNDLYAGLPDFMREADCVFVDPPWNLGNENSFRTKAQIAERSQSFTAFLDALFAAIDTIGPRTCFIEMGRQNVREVEQRLSHRFAHVHAYRTTYYGKKPCYVLRGGAGRGLRDYSDMDEIEVIAGICRDEPFNCIADICMGRGEVGVEAFRNGRRFVGTDLNRNRLAVMINRIAEIGGVWTQA